MQANEFQGPTSGTGFAAIPVPVFAFPPLGFGAACDLSTRFLSLDEMRRVHTLAADAAGGPGDELRPFEARYAAAVAVVLVERADVVAGLRAVKLLREKWGNPARSWPLARVPGACIAWGVPIGEDEQIAAWEAVAELGQRKLAGGLVAHGWDVVEGGTDQVVNVSKPEEAPTTYQALKTKLGQRGLAVSKRDGEYRVAFPGDEASAYYTNDVADAWGTGLDMARRRDAARRR